MSNKKISNFTDQPVPVEDTTDILMEEVSGVYKKATIKNILKRLFGHQDVYGEYLVNAFGFGNAGGSTSPVFKEFRNGLYLWAFEAVGQVQEGFFVVHLGHQMKENTDMYFHIHWTHNVASPTGNIKWNIDYSVAKSYNISQYPAPTTLSSIQAANAQYTHQITDDDDMVVVSGAELEPDSILICRVWRDYSGDAQDTFNGDAFFLHADIHFVASRVGTTERNRPFTSGGF